MCVPKVLGAVLLEVLSSVLQEVADPAFLEVPGPNPLIMAAAAVQ